MSISLYEFADTDIVAAPNLRSAVRCYESETGILRREALESVQVMSKERAASWMYHEDIDDCYREDHEKKGYVCSISVELKRRVDAGERFPQMLATSEW